MGGSISLSPLEQKECKDDKPYSRCELGDLKWCAPLLADIRKSCSKEIAVWEGVVSPNDNNESLVVFIYHLMAKLHYEAKYLKWVGAMPWNAEKWKEVYKKSRVVAFQLAQISTVNILAQLDDEVIKPLMLSELFNKKYPVPKNKWKVTDMQDLKLDGASSGIKQEVRVGAVEMGCMDAAQVLVLQGYRTMMLNFANETSPAGVHWGRQSEGGTQEEDIFKRTTVLASLWHRRNSKIKHDPYWEGLPERSKEYFEPYYPISGPEDAIYSPNVIYFRRSRVYNYELLPFEKQVSLAVVTAAAPINPKRWQRVTMKNLREALNQKIYKVFRLKIRTIYRVAATKKIEALVLGAWGCGAFGNNPLAVATLFKEVMEEKEFKGAGFKRVVFAVIGDRLSVGNVVAPFINVFGEVDINTMNVKN